MTRPAIERAARLGYTIEDSPLGRRMIDGCSGYRVSGLALRTVPIDILLGDLRDLHAAGRPSSCTHFEPRTCAWIVEP